MEAPAGKNKLRGEARDAISGTNTWAEMRRVLVSLFASSKPEFQLNNELKSVNQRNHNVEEFYKIVKDFMIDLLVKSTQGLNRDQYDEMEASVKETARLAFLNGLRSDIASHVGRQNPTSLEQAFQMARERSVIVGEEQVSPVQIMIELRNQMREEFRRELDNRFRQGTREGKGMSRDTYYDNISGGTNSNKYCSHHKTTTHNTRDCQFLLKMKGEKKGDKYCSHHKNHTHDTNECRYLQGIANRSQQMNQMNTLSVQPNQRFNSEVYCSAGPQGGIQNFSGQATTHPFYYQNQNFNQMPMTNWLPSNMPTQINNQGWMSGTNFPQGPPLQHPPPQGM